MAQIFKNNARAALTAGISTGATTITIDPARADLFPVANTDTAAISLAADWFKATLQNTTGAVEIIYVRTRTLGSGVLSNVLRGQEGTTALAFIIGDICSLRMTALDLANSAEYQNTASIYGKTLLTAITDAAARIVLGVSTIGEAIFTAASEAAARSSLGLGTAATGNIGTDVQAYNANNAVLNVAQAFTAAQRGAVSALTDAATITPDFAVANNFSITLGDNRTLANPTNQTAGQSGVIVITQDGTGSRTLAYGSNWKFPAGAAPTLTTTAAAVDVLVYQVESASRITARLVADVK